MKTYEVTVTDAETVWKVDGVTHREGGPAVETARGESWYQNGRLHCDDGPAIREKNGAWKFFKEGKLHRDGAEPAVFTKEGVYKYYVDGKLHNTEGPAIAYPDGTYEFWIEGKQLSEREFIRATEPVVEMTLRDVENLIGHKVRLVDDLDDDESEDEDSEECSGCEACCPEDLGFTVQELNRAQLMRLLDHIL